MRGWVPPAALALALTAAAFGCAKAEDGPVATVKAFENAVARRDSKAMMELVDVEVVDDLEQRAGKATDQVGGRRVIEAHEMLQIIDVDPEFRSSSFDLVTSDGEHATVEVTSVQGERRNYALVQQEGRWRVKVPRPSFEADAADDAS